ncbi:MAG: hypothetical protein ATN36_07720 [Epulopiscium sp. Nele67-Bin005]|nr:MAG: hypothetical protein ATN36_07720 [Epulopiscium sp. Nele67-Bin005]
MEKFNKLKLETKLCIFMVSLTTISILSLVSIILIRNMTTTADLIRNQLATYSELNSALVQNKFNTANTVGTNLATYVGDKLTGTSSEENLAYSRFYNKKISLDLIAIEDYLYNNISTNLANNTLYDAIGVYFEPYAFDENMSAYAFYTDSNHQIVTYNYYDDYAHEDYYATVKASRETFLTNPYIGETGYPILTLSVPITNNGNFIGIVTVDLRLADFIDTTVSDEKYPSLFSAILTNNFDVVFNSTTYDKMGVNISNIVTSEGVTDAFKYAAKEAPFNYNTISLQGEKHERYLYPIDAFGHTWWAHVAVETKDIYSETLNSTILSIILGTISLCLTTFIIVWLIKKYLRPLETLTDVASDIEHGNLSINVTAPYDDDVGKIIHDFNATGKSLSNIVNEIETVLREMANGNFVIEDKVNGTYNGDFSTIKVSMLNISEMLKETLTKISLTTQELKTNSQDIAHSASTLAQSSNEQTDLLGEFVHTTENMAVAITNINTKVNENTETGIIAKNTAISGKEAMEDMLVAMNSISQSSKTIASVLTIIEAITKQTNLLALNAAIEASRAGDAGKGFGVVANEIRELANRSSDTVKQIDGIIKLSLEDVEKGQQMANKTATSFMEISATIDKNVAISEELLIMSDAQKASIDELVGTIKQISQSVTENTASAQESTAISEQLASQALHLEKLMQQFKCN